MNGPDGRLCTKCGSELSKTAPITSASKSAERDYAGFWVRLAAAIVDSIVFQAALFVVIFINPGLSILLALTVQFLYSVSFIEENGQTLGKRLMKIRVVDEHGNPPSLRQALVRETLGKILSAICLFLGFLTMITNKEKRGWHDKISGTYVVYDDLR